MKRLEFLKSLFIAPIAITAIVKSESPIEPQITGNIIPEGTMKMAQSSMPYNEIYGDYFVGLHGWSTNTDIEKEMRLGRETGIWPIGEYKKLS